MKIFRIRPLANKNGDFVFKDVVHKESDNWHKESHEKIDLGIPLEMVLNRGVKKKKFADFIPSTAPGKLFSGRAMERLKKLFSSTKCYQVIVDGQYFQGVWPNNYSCDSVGIDHILIMYPKHGYTMVSETFKHLWEENGFTGAEFEEVDEIDDAAFIPVS